MLTSTAAVVGSGFQLPDAGGGGVQAVFYYHV